MVGTPDLKDIRRNIEDSWDRIESRIDHFVEEGKKWTEKARSRDILDRLATVQENLQEKMGVDYSKIYDVLNIATRDEVDELHKKIRSLERRVRELKAEVKPKAKAKAKPRRATPKKTS